MDGDAQRTLVLGAGFGGLAVATELRRLLGPDHEIVLVDRAEEFSMGLRKLWEVAGLGTIAEGRRSRTALAAAEVRFVRGEVEELLPDARAAIVGGQRLEADFLVVALGAEPRPDLVPGLAEHAHDVWNPANVAAARDAVAELAEGRIALLVAGAPYPCPPAPYELALLLDERLRREGRRERVELAVATVQPLLLPNAGRDGSAWVGERLAARGIAFEAARTLERVEPGRAVFAEGDLEADVLIGVPPHRAPAVVRGSGLTGEGEWIRIDPATLATDRPGVFALGDVTQVTLANGLPLPKAGVIAELEGLRVAAAIAAELRGGEEPAPFDGRGYCFLETGGSEAALVEGDFFARPEPLVRIREPSTAAAEGKRRFEAERLERWFGR